jgi:molybdate/tungstate transport system substrate-binding protein
MRIIERTVLMFLVAGMLCFTFCGDAGKPNPASASDIAKTDEITKIHVLHAGSLSIPFKDMAQAFMKKHPQYKVLLEGHGSRTCARQITDLNREVDMMGSADSAVIRNLLMPEHADFCIDFTTNEMVLMYTEKSKHAESINDDNWYEILLKPDVQYGHSDPNADPCGYRARLTQQLAEKHYNIPGLYQKLTDKMPRKNIRPKETDLIAMLEAGELDYIFIYRSVAEQHHAKYVLLPEEISLKSARHAEFYKTATLKITGKKPGEWIEKKGAPMVYGITIPINAPNRDGAIAFLSFILGPEGQEIMKKNGQPEIIPPEVDNLDKLPEAIKTFFN